MLLLSRNRSQKIAGRIAHLCLSTLLLLVFDSSTQAQQPGHTVGATLDLVSGGTNNPYDQVSGSATRPFSLFYSVFPAFNVNSTGNHSTFNFSYAGGLNRNKDKNNPNSDSHQASLLYSRLLSPKTRITFSESFQWTADAATFNGLRGVSAPVQDFNFVFFPVAVRRVARTVNSTIAVDYTFDEKSSVSMSGSANVRNYGGGGQLGGSLLNHQGGSGTFTYRRRTGPRDTWSFAYTGSYFRFSGFDNTSSHSGSMAYAKQVTPRATFHMSVGVTEARDLKFGTNYIGYDTVISFQRAVLKTNSISINYNQQSGQPAGLGAVSDTRRVGFSVNHTGKRLGLFADIAAFDTQGTLGNAFNSRGASAAGNIGFYFSRYVSLQTGAQFQSYRQIEPFGFTQKRLFVSLRFSDPNLIRW